MFKILHQKNVSTRDLTTSFVEIEAYKGTLEEDLQITQNALVDLQQEAMSGNSVATKIKKMSALKEDIEIKVEACDRGMDQLKSWMISLIPQERDSQREALTQKLEKLKKDENSLFRDFFSLCAQAIVLREKIMGSDLRRNSMGDMLENNPRLDIQAFSSGMNTEDSVFLCNEVKRLRPPARHRDRSLFRDNGRILKTR